MIIINQIDKKLRGGYYTPPDVALAIAHWAIDEPQLKVLEPSFGAGAFVDASVLMKRKLKENNVSISDSVYGVELNTEECLKTRGNILASSKIALDNLICDDFFNWFEHNNENFDVILGNPPFIRYQNFPEPSRSKALKISQKLGIKLNRLTNIWVPFIVASVSLLNINGRLGMVVPAEMLQVSYANKLRSYLIDSFVNISIFSCNELFFEGAEQETLIILADKKKKDIYEIGGIELIETESKRDLISSIETYKSPVQKKTVIHSTEKWTKYFLDQDEIDFMRTLKKDERITVLGDFFDVDVGVVTGRNSFFIVNKDTAQAFNLEDYVRPAIGRSFQLKEDTLEKADWLSLWNNGANVGLLDFSVIGSEIPPNVQRYLEHGMKQDIHKGYKCSIRKEWFKVPSLWEPYGFLFRQIHDFPHLIVNKAGAVSTDTIHRLRKKSDDPFPHPVFYTYLTASSAEIEGRSYGGGVLELEPTEAEKLLIPNPELLRQSDLNYTIERRQNGTFLEKNSRFILCDLLGFSTSEVDMLKNIYLKMSDRRKKRKVHQGKNYL
jgi:adenine-specific DNA methylase